MPKSISQQLSNDLATAVAGVAPSLVLLRGRRGRAASGTAIDPDTLVVSDHLLDVEEEMRIRTADGEASARVIGRDGATDLALLHVEGATLPAVTLAAAPLRVGDIVVAAGRTWSGLVAHTGFVTHLSGPHHVAPGVRVEQAIHTSLAPFSGFSGGALLNAQGEVAGISTSALHRGHALAIPAGDVRRITSDLRQHGRLRRGFLGISSLPIALPARQQQGATERGLLVTSVAPESPADHAELLVGDVIVAIEDVAVVRPDDLAGYLTGERVGQRVTVHLIRGTAPVDVGITIGARGSGRA